MNCKVVLMKWLNILKIVRINNIKGNYMKQAKKILFKSHDIKIVNGRAANSFITEDEFEYAKSKGLMFPFRKTVSHKVCLC